MKNSSDKEVSRAASSCELLAGRCWSCRNRRSDDSDYHIHSLPGDISTKEGISKLVDDYSKLESHLDVLVNCAGVLGDKLNITSDDKDDSGYKEQTEKMFHTLISEIA